VRLAPAAPVVAEPVLDHRPRAFASGVTSNGAHLLHLLGARTGEVVSLRPEPEQVLGHYLFERGGSMRRVVAGGIAVLVFVLTTQPPPAPTRVATRRRARTPLR
jgi:hypothetical protein